MKRIFKISEIKKAILFTSGLALVASCRSRQFLRTKTLRVDFRGKAISVADFTVYTDFFNRCYLLENGTEAQKVKVAATQVKKMSERAPDLDDMLPKHIDDKMGRVSKKF